MRISQPKNKSINTPNGYLNLKWTKNFSKLRTEQFIKAQRFVDSECIRLMGPYTPTLNGVLYKSANIGTKIGSGEIHQNTPYARYLYYGKLMVSPSTGSSYAKSGESKVLTDKDLNFNASRHPKAGKMWFERMKADNKSAILKGASKIAGGKAE
ncbi:MAG: hypothetical protein J1F17_07585 [Oscillospiraceae bacterium]|nr:hypothetical protein [Oscillospiraceae bacterium]